MLSSSVALTVLRYFLTLAGGALVARGYATDGIVQMATGVILGGVNGYIGAASSTHSAKIEAAAKLPEVDKIVRTDGFEVSHSNLPAPPMTDR